MAFASSLTRSVMSPLVRYDGTLFQFAYKTFYVQRAAVNEDSCDRARRAHSLAIFK